MNQKAQDWIVERVGEEIVGCCMSISNNCYHEYPIRLEFYSATKSRDLLKDLDRIASLLNMFADILSVETIVDDYFSKNDNHWKMHIRTFKLYVKDALQRARDSKLEEIGI